MPIKIKSGITVRVMQDLPAIIQHLQYHLQAIQFIQIPMEHIQATFTALLQLIRQLIIGV